MKTIFAEIKHFSLLAVAVLLVPMLTGIITDNYQLAEISAVMVLAGLVLSYVCYVASLILNGK